MRTIMGSFRRDCVLVILFQLYDSKCGLFEINLFLGGLLWVFLFDTDPSRYQNNAWNCSKLTIKTPGRHHWRRSAVFIINFEQISHIDLVFLLLTLNK